MSDPKVSTAVDFLFDSEGNLPSPQEFWDVFKGVIDSKPISFKVFNQKVTINSSDVEEIKNIFENKK